MSSLNPHPIGGRLCFKRFQLEIWGFLLALHHSSRVNLVTQNSDNGGCGPFAILLVCIAALCIRNTVGTLVRKRRENACIVQLISNTACAVPVQTLAEYVPHNICGKGVNDKSFVGVTRLEVAIHSKRSNKIAVAPLYVKCASGFYGNVTAVFLVHYVFDRNRQLVGFLIQSIEIIVDSDKTHSVSREHRPQETPCFNVLSAKTGQVLDDNAVGFARFYHLHHLHKCGTVVENAAVTVINLFGNDFNIIVLCDEIVYQLSLVGYAVAFHGSVIRVGQSDVLYCPVNLHKKTLLSSRYKMPAVQGVSFAIFNSFSTVIIPPTRLNVKHYLIIPLMQSSKLCPLSLKLAFTTNFPHLNI